MRKTSPLLWTAILAAIVLIALSCIKKDPYFRYRYAIVQTTRAGQPTSDSAISQADIGLRIWIVPERYFDRFAYHPAQLFVSQAYAADISNNNTVDPEENDSLESIDIWYLPGSAASIADSTTLSSFVQFRVQDSDEWMFEKQAVAYFNQQAFARKMPQYIDVRFDKFFHYTGYGYFSLKLYTRRTRPYLYSTSNTITLQ